MFIPWVSNLSVLLICPIISFALRGCTSRGTQRACSISSMIQYQLAVASIATGVPGRQPPKNSEMEPRVCSSRHWRTRPVSTSSLSTQL